MVASMNEVASLKQSQLREQLKQYADEQSLLLDIAQRIAGGGPLGGLLGDITGMVLRGLQADGVRILLNSPSTAFAAGSLAESMARLDAWVLNAAQDVLESPVFKARHDLPAELAAGTMIALPLKARGVLQGVLWVAFKEAHTLSPAERNFLDILAAQAAVAVANAAAFEAAQRGRQQLAAILTSSADPILVVDSQNLIVLLNPAAEQVFGINGVVGKAVSDVIDAEAIVGLLDDPESTTEAIEWQSGTGQTFSPRVSDMVNDQAERTGRVLILRDISRYKSLRENQGEFVSTVSHDLRSPLTYMNGYVDMLPMVGEFNDKQRYFAEKISTGIMQMTDLIDKVLDASRLDPDGNYQLHREPCDITKVVSDVVYTHIGPAEKKGLTLTTDMSEQLPVLNLDEMMVKRALNNLTDNAIKYTPSGGQIRVRALIKDNDLLLCVQDNGPGLTEENQKHLFERFRRVRRRDHQSVKGSGLGLYIVKRVAERHGGKAWVESAESKGSSFFFSIPMDGSNLVGSKS
jgi:PAS domain S-box-containing protein